MVIFVSVCLLFQFFSNHLRPVVETVAVSEATNLISVTVSEVVQQCTSQWGIDYQDLMEVHQETETSLTTVTGNTAEINRLRSQITQSLVTRLESLDSGQLGVPLGNLTGWMLLSGLGPELRVSIDSVGDVITEIYNQFDSAGINQTHHQVLMDITVTVYLFIPGEITSVTVDSTVCLAETVFIGTVPNSYLKTG